MYLDRSPLAIILFTFSSVEPIWPSKSLKSCSVPLASVSVFFRAASVWAALSILASKLLLLVDAVPILLSKFVFKLSPDVILEDRSLDKVSPWPFRVSRLVFVEFAVDVVSIKDFLVDKAVVFEVSRLSFAALAALVLWPRSAIVLFPASVFSPKTLMLSLALVFSLDKSSFKVSDSPFVVFKSWRVFPASVLDVSS